MARKPRLTPGGFVYHVLNRSAGRFKFFRSAKDFDAFHRVLLQAHERHPLRILSYCLMNNHWHFVVWPRYEGEVTAFFRWLAHTHAMRWRVAHNTVGYGHLYQGRFKSFPIKRDEHLSTVCRYVERNPLTAGAVKRAEDWRWSSLYVREHGSDELRSILTDGPTPRRADWLSHVNEPLTQKETERLEISLKRGRPFGDDTWTQRTAQTLGLEHTLRSEGRPKKQSTHDKCNSLVAEQT
jgi:putative transposase